MPLNESIESQLKALYEGYAQKLPEKQAEIDSTWEELNRCHWDIGILKLFHRMIHSLAGSGASFGYPEVSTRARALEVQLKDLLVSERRPRPEEVAAMQQSLQALRHCLTGVRQTDGTTENLPSRVNTGHSTASSRLVCAINCHPKTLQNLAVQMRHFGYGILPREWPSNDQQYDEKPSPVALIVETSSTEIPAERIEWLNRYRKSMVAEPPMIFISNCTEMEARLQAVRAGASAYLTQPVDIGTLADKLDKLTAREPANPYRVLIVDDDASLSSRYALILQDAGMLATTALEPTEVMQRLTDFDPDLILMDVYMPNYTGVEMASVIRQMDSYVSIPIVFLSTEANIDKQLAVMQLGADDFLTKSIQSNHLIATLTTRMERARDLRSLMVRDSLTGLLNHRRIREQLEIEIARARRQGSQLVFSMLDIDHFKLVNDLRGHMVGDHVLKTLARLLQQRLRQTDVIGRYGGEEFAVILPDTDEHAAIQLMNELRSGFAQVRHQVGNEEFSVTFSCGVAGFPTCPSSDQLIEAADQAMYQAKAQGRNRAVLSANARS